MDHSVVEVEVHVAEAEEEIGFRFIQTICQEIIARIDIKKRKNKLDSHVANRYMLKQESQADARLRATSVRV